MASWVDEGWTMAQYHQEADILSKIYYVKHVIVNDVILQYNGYHISANPD